VLAIRTGHQIQRETFYQDEFQHSHGDIASSSWRENDPKGSQLTPRILDKTFVSRRNPMQRIRQALSMGALVTISLAPILTAQDACIALLQHGIYDTHVSKSSTQSYAMFKSSFCGWYSSYRQTHQSAGAGIAIPIADIPIGLSGSMTYGEADAMSQALCSAQASASSSDSTWQQIDKTLNTSGTQAFSSCVQALRGGLSIDFRVNDTEDQLSIGLSYNAPLGAGPATLNLIKNDGWICAPPGAPQIDLHSIAGRPGGLTNSQVGMTCNRDVKPNPFILGGQKVVAGSAELTLQTTAGLFTNFFRPKLYEDPIADTAKVLASYPKGTILPFAGPSSSIPNCWHLCDGSNGTVNLLDRLPYGASGDGQIGQMDGQLTHTHAFDGGRTADADIGGFVPGHAFECCQGDHLQDHSHSFAGGTTHPSSNLPPVTRVYFIQKIS
jgi:hypothetical protein